MYHPRVFLMRAALCAVALLATSSALQAQISLKYINRLGFLDPRHTGPGGLRNSNVVGLSDAGYSAGHSQRFFGGDSLEQNFPNRSGWIASPWGGTKSAGFYDAAHRSATGVHSTRIERMTRSGKVTGYSARFLGGDIPRGETAWIADWAGGTRRVGLFYDAPPLPQNTVINQIVAVNEAGQLIGYARTGNARKAWFASANGNTTPIGLEDPTLPWLTGEPSNTPLAINASGTVIGHAAMLEGVVAWYRGKNGGPSHEIGLFGPAYLRQSNAAALNDRGLIAGYTYRSEPYSGDIHFFTGWVRKPSGEMVIIDDNRDRAALPQLITHTNLVGGIFLRFGNATAWVYNANDGTLHPAGHDASVNNDILALTADGVAVGSAVVSDGADNEGFHAWITPYAGPTHEIGFYDEAHRLDETVHFIDFRSAIVAVAENGRTIGYSDRGPTGDGRSAWLATPAGQTTRIGLFDAEHTGPNGEQFSIPVYITASGFVAGYSRRYNSDGSADLTGWIYNSMQRAYARFDFYLPGTGEGGSAIDFLVENGIGGGTYLKQITQLPNGGQLYENHGALWVTRRGIADIGDALDVDPADKGWRFLQAPLFGNQAGYVVGRGFPPGPLNSSPAGVYLVKLENPPPPRSP